MKCLAGFSPGLNPKQRRHAGPKANSQNGTKSKRERMGNPNLLSLKLGFTFSLFVSITLSSSSSSFYHFLPKIAAPSPPYLPKISLSSSSSSSRSRQQKLASDLLSLLGGEQDAARIDDREAHRIRSCLRFLVPFSPPRPRHRPLSRGFEKLPYRRRRDLLAGGDELVRWPPAPVLELARIAVDSGGDPAAIQRALDPTVLPVPDLEGCRKDRCQLTRTPYGWRFIDQELNSYLAFLFEMIAARAPMVGLNVSLSRYDLFHGHIFLATNSGRLGILFHAKEYPAYEKDEFPYNMGFCQKGSDVMYDDAINLRNILWVAPLPSKVAKAWVAPGVLVILDAHPEGIIYEELVPEYVDYVRTIYEDDLGDAVADVNYLNAGGAAPGDRIFIC